MALPLLPIALGIGVLVALASSGKPAAAAAANKPPPAPPPPAPATPGELAKPTPPVDKIIAAVASGSSKAMRDLAAQLRSAGWEQQAQDLEAAATTADRIEMERQRASAASAAAAAAEAARVTSSPGIAATTPQPSLVAPPALVNAAQQAAAELEAAARQVQQQAQAAAAQAPQIAIEPPPVLVPQFPPYTAQYVPDTSNPRRALAQRAALSVVNSGPSYDMPTMKAYQAQEGLPPSGYYGPGSALGMFKYAIVPPTPIYWDKSDVSGSKKRYRQQLLYQATKDIPRAPEWQAAAAAVPS